MSFVSYAQNREDVMLRRALAGIERGFYVDVGANDPVVDSVTKAFHDAGWRGINVEPVEHWFRKLEADRPDDVNLRVAASDRAGEIELFVIGASGLSTSDGGIADRHARELSVVPSRQRVPSRTLTDICIEHAPGEIHFLKIDVEGAEAAVLEGLDLSRIRPWILVVESTLPNRPEESAGWEPRITGHGYHFVWFDGLNRFYVADEHARLDAAFRTPPSVWDDFEPYGQAAAREAAAASRARAAEIAGRLALSEEALERSRDEHARELREWQDRTRETEAELRAMRSSRSWRLTIPLRLASRAVREATHAPDGRRLGASETVRATGAVAGKGARKIARRARRFVAGHPPIRRALRAVVGLVPGLESALRRRLAPVASAPSPTAGPAGSAEALPVRARRVLAELRATPSRPTP